MSPRRTTAGVVAALVGATALGLANLFGGVAAAAPDPAPPSGEPQPAAYLVADADSGAVIAAAHEHQPLPPASTAKLMTALVGLEKLPLDAKLTVSALAARQPAMSINMKEGQQWPFVDVLHALLMASANDAAYAIAENASGSLEQFDADLQSVGHRLGLRDSTLSDPAGLDAQGEGFRGGSLMSAYDLAVVARNALAVPAIADTAKQHDDYHFIDPTGLARSVPNHDDTWLTTYPGATGLKTGYTEKANRTLVATATRNGRTCIAVVLGVYDTNGWAQRLTDQCFAAPATAPAGTVKLPPVRVATVDARRAAVDGFPRVLGAPAVEVAGARLARADTGSATTPATDPTPSTTAAPNPTKAVTAADRFVAASGASGSGEGGAGVLTLRNVLLVLVLVAAGLVFLRRRAVKRLRRKRAARQKMLAEARRRGVLQVIDPESNPIEGSHVSVVPRTPRGGSRGPSSGSSGSDGSTRPRRHSEV